MLRNFERNKMQEQSNVCLLGTEIIENIIATNLIRVRDEQFFQNDGITDISDVDFSINIRKVPGLMNQLEGITEDFFSLFYYVEKNEALRLPMKEGAVLRSFIPFEKTSGMTLLNLFSKGVLSLTVSGSQAVLAADTVFFDGMENGTEALENLMNTVFAFREEDRILMITEKTEALVKTDVLAPGMRLTYEYRDDFEKTLKASLAKGVDFPKNFGLTRREANVRKEREALLGNIKALMDGINGETEEPEESEKPAPEKTPDLKTANTEEELRAAVLREIALKQQAREEAEQELSKENREPEYTETYEEDVEEPWREDTEPEEDETEEDEAEEDETKPAYEDSGDELITDAPELPDDYAESMKEKERRHHHHKEVEAREEREARAYKNHYTLKFSSPVLYDKEDYSVQLPDGYEFGDDVDGHDFALWKCHHGHRKFERAYVSLTDNGELPIGQRAETHYDGATLRMEFPVMTSKRTIRFEVRVTNVPPEEEMKAREFAKELAGAIQPL